jgi:hypothetical protein
MNGSSTSGQPRAKRHRVSNDPQYVDAEVLQEIDPKVSLPFDARNGEASRITAKPVSDVNVKTSDCVLVMLAGSLGGSIAYDCYTLYRCRARNAREDLPLVTDPITIQHKVF